MECLERTWSCWTIPYTTNFTIMDWRLIVFAPCSLCIFHDCTQFSRITFDATTLNLLTISPVAVHVQWCLCITMVSDCPAVPFIQSKGFSTVNYEICLLACLSCVYTNMYLSILISFFLIAYECRPGELPVYLHMFFVAM